MITLFEDTTTKLEFLKKYKLAAPTVTDIPTLYYFAPGSDIPSVCEVIGYETIYDGWAVIVIKADNKTINIHSSYLLEMKTRGREYVRGQKIDSTPSSQKDSQNTYVVFDIETTGLDRKSDEIIEIAAIKHKDDDIIEFRELINIDSIIPVNITLLTGIKNEDVQDADTIDIVMPKFLSFIGNATLVGHNAKSFDIPFVNKFCSDLGLPNIKNKIIDTKHLAKNKLPELDNYQLSTLCEYYNIDTSNAHHALFDCYMCDSVYRQLTSQSDTIEVTTASSPFQEKLLSILEKIITEKELPAKGLRLRENKNMNTDSYSVLISEPPYPVGSERLGGEQSIMKIALKTNGYDIDILQSVYHSITCPPNTTYKELKKTGNTPQHIIISFMTDDSDFYDYIQAVILYRLAHYRTAESTFSCCSRFNQCSDAKKCIHENKLYSTACTYRKNLEAGRIFYGKNKNID